jgi:hypothetical protein
VGRGVNFEWKWPLLLAASVLFEGETARACGACLCDDQPRPLLSLVRGVPLNLQIPLRVAHEAEAAPWIERATDKTKVLATVERREAPGVWWLAVDQDLEPNTDYFIMRESGPEAGFTTGSARDEEPPELQGVSVVGGGNEALCSDSAGGYLELTGASDAGDTFNVWLEIEVVMGPAPYIVYSDYIDTSQRVAFGSSTMSCFGPLEIPGMVAGNGYAVGVALHDAAGNVSQFQTAVFNAVANEPASCGTPSETAGSSGSSTSDPGGSGGSAAATPGGSGNQASPDPEGDRTSKGCGCALPAGPQRWPAEALLAGLLLLGCAARRRSLT